MPVYEYHCKSCRRKVSLLVKGYSSPPELVCPRCGSADMIRLFSTFTLGRSFESDYEDILSDNGLVKGLENNDPRALAEWGKRMSRSMDDDSMAPEWEDTMYNMEQGRYPEETGKADSGKDSVEEDDE